MDDVTPPPNRRLLVVIFCIVAALIFFGLLGFILTRSTKRSPKTPTPSTSNTSQTIQSTNQLPTLTTSVVIQGVDHPWDLVFLPDGHIVFDQRAGGLYLLSGNAATLIHKPEDLIAKHEGGMLGLTLDPEYTANHFLYLCYLSQKPPAVPEVKVSRLTMKEDVSGVVASQDIVTSIPTNSIGQLGRHSGCRLAFGPDGFLWIGTGDAAMATNAQNPKGLGGKVLRVDRDGKAASGNLPAPFDPRIYSTGHRNIQGLAFWPKDKAPKAYAGVTVEHGPDKEDEVNALTGGNFGWDPVPAPYNENVPMTDLKKYPGAISALWNTGGSTMATSGSTFVSGNKWGAWDNALFIGILKDQHVRVLTFDAEGNVAGQYKILDQFGRVRTVVEAPDQSLMLLTDNGNNTDQIIRITASTN